MRKTISRRGLFELSACVGTASLLQTEPVPAQDKSTPSDPLVCLSTYFYRGRGAKFNAALFHDHYIPLARELYGGSLDRIELRLPLGLQTPTFLACVNVWIRNLEAYSAAKKKADSVLAADLAEITDAQMSGQFDKVIAEYGRPRTSISTGTRCASDIYASKKSGRWDADYFKEKYLPQLIKAFGTVVFLRVEALTGIVALGGGKPLFVGTVNYYFESQDAIYKNGPGQFRSRPEPTLDKLTNIEPYTETFEVIAIG